MASCAAHTVWGSLATGKNASGSVMFCSSDGSFLVILPWLPSGDMCRTELQYSRFCLGGES